MKHWLKSLLVALFAAVPSAILVADYMRSGTINWVLFVVWVVIIMLCIAFVQGGE